MRLPERVRRQLMSETGMDFGRLVPSARQVVSEERAGGGLIAALAWGMSIGLIIAVALMGVTVLSGAGGVGAFFGFLASVIAGLGAAMLSSAVLFRRRLPDEVDEVFRVAGQVAADASDQLEAVTGSAEQLVRGLVMVSAIPAVTAVVSKRFLVFAPVVRSLLEGLLARLVDRGLPTVMATMPDASPKIMEIATGVAASRDRVVGRVGALGRWVTAPVLLGGIVLVTLGGAVVSVILVSALL